MATVDDLVDQIQSTASNYASRIRTQRYYPHGTYDSLDIDPVDKISGDFGSKYDQTPIDTTSAADAVKNFTKPFSDMLLETPDDVDELLDGLKDQSGRITSDLSAILMRPEDFTPQLILQTYREDLDRFLDKSNDWFEDYLENHSPISPENINKANDVLDDMLDGLGLPPVVLENIWSQARDQAVAEAQSLESQAYSDFAARGYAKPPGALTTSLQNIRYQRYNKTAAASRDVAIKQAEIIIDLQKFAVQTAFSVYNDFINALIGYLRAYLTSTTGLMRDLYSQPLNAKVEYVLGMNRLLLQGDETYLRSLQTIPDIATRGGELAALPYEVQAKLLAANNQLAGIDAEFARIGNDAKRANLDAQVRIRSLKADYQSRLEGTRLGGEYQLGSASWGAEGSKVSAFGRVAATALSGLNAIASSTEINI